jgi:transglutaminase-like putative cysteine protease
MGSSATRDFAIPLPPDSTQSPVQDLPFETLVYLLGSRYCDTDLLSDEAWRLFENTPPGWARVQAICDFVKDSVSFDYMQASATRTASETMAGGHGVCRDFAHLAIAFCRCMNIPARYCTGYLSEIGEPAPHAPDDFAAWMEVFLDGHWWVFRSAEQQPAHRQDPDRARSGRGGRSADPDVRAKHAHAIRCLDLGRRRRSRRGNARTGN